MKLRVKDYEKLLEGTILCVEIEDVAAYIHAQYLKYKEDNPEFSQEVREAINYLHNTINRDKLRRGLDRFLNEISRSESEAFGGDEKAVKPPLYKIVWKGKLKEFSELIFELQRQGWIDIEHGSLRAAADTLCSCFDFSDTKKSEHSNTVTSLMQDLKPGEKGERIFTKRYLPKFGLIKAIHTKK